MWLDLGCGNPEVPNSIKVPDSLGVDIKKGFCDVQADICHLPFKTSSVERVFIIHVLEHVDVRSTIKEIVRVLEEGGVLVLEIPNPYYALKILRYVKRGFFEPSEKYFKSVERPHIQTFSHTEITYLLRWAGFKIKQVSFSRSHHTQKHYRLLDVFLTKLFPHLNPTFRIIATKLK